MPRTPADRGPSEGAEPSTAVVTSLPCVLCGHRGRQPRSVLYMTHGIAIWLCDLHRSEGFMKRRSGHAFVERLAAVWAASGVLTIRRQDALQAHLQRIQTAKADREQPGSYSWPLLRREAERRFAAGEPPSQVIPELRQNYCDGPAMVPSIRTMRRWFTQARWLATAPSSRRRQPRRAETTTRSESPWQPFVNVMLTGVARTPRSPFSRLRRVPDG